jgi:site-specific recombinase XerD
MDTHEVRSRKRPIQPESDLVVGYLDLLKEDLHAKRYAPETIRRYVTAARAFFCWLANHNIGAADVSKETIRRYVRSLERVPTSSARKLRLPHSGVGLQHLLETLHKHGIANPTEPAISTTAAELWLQEYEHFLDHVLGSAVATRQKYRLFARRFLSAFCGAGQLDWGTLRADMLTEFVQQEAAKRTGFGRKTPATAIRTMLRYLVVQGNIPAGLDAAVPIVRQWRHAALPQYLSTTDIANVLSTCADGSPLGLRNYAILLILARLGIRGNEVAHITLDDIDWIEGRLLIRNVKNHCERRLPLPQDVGQALIDYLQHARPSTAHRTIFLSFHAPFQPLQTPTAITHIVHRCLANAGISVSKGYAAHLFRHAAATQMVRGGASFKQVADVLGHHSLQTTAIYAKLDIAALSQVALPWPGGVQ